MRSPVCLCDYFEIGDTTSWISCAHQHYLRYSLMHTHRPLLIPACVTAWVPCSLSHQVSVASKMKCWISSKCLKSICGMLCFTQEGREGGLWSRASPLANRCCQPFYAVLLYICLAVWIFALIFGFFLCSSCILHFEFARTVAILTPSYYYLEFFLLVKCYVMN